MPLTTPSKTTISATQDENRTPKTNMIPMIPCTQSTVSILMQTAITPAALKEMIPKGFFEYSFEESCFATVDMICQNQPLNRIKTDGIVDYKEEDKIGLLPDYLIIEILSCLPTAKDVIVIDVEEEMRQLLVPRLRHVKHPKLWMMLLEVLYRSEDEGFIIPSNIEHTMDDGPKAFQPLWILSMNSSTLLLSSSSCNSMQTAITPAALKEMIPKGFFEYSFEER
nr:65-kDa microtubule-associated protein 3-like [Tanacetum cinerariifolium]